MMLGVIFPFLSGCWDRIEVNDLALVMGTGIDTAPNGKIRLTAQIANPSQYGQSSSSSSGQLPFIVVSTSGVNKVVATQRMQEKLSRKVYNPHRSVLIIGETLARRGIQPLLDQFTRDPKSRLDTFVLVAKGTTANALLQIPYPYEGVPMEAVREIERSKVAPAITLRELIDITSSGTMSAILPAIEKTVLPNGKGNKTFRIAGAAIFRHTKLAGWLDDDRTRGVMWLRKEVQKTTITARVEQKPGYISMDLLDITTKLHPKKEQGQVIMHVNTEATGDVIENTTGLDLGKPENDAIVNQAFSAELQRRICASLYTIQHQYKTDVLGFAEILHKEDLPEWKKLSNTWDQEFPKLKVTLHAKVKIRQIGMINHIK
jgi:spore germination protein KC